MPEQVKKSLVISIYFALAVIALLVFWQVRNFSFTNYDDDVYVYENPHVLNGLSPDNIIWAFTTGFASFWHPLTWLSLMLDQQLFGTSPAGFHITNLILHIANTLILFLVLRQMTQKLWQSAFVAALFAIHPLHVESVAWVAERKDVLSTFFWLLTMWAYARYAKNPKLKWYLISLVLFALGLMAKPMLITLPFVLLLLDYWPLNRIKHFDRQIVYRLVLEKIPFIVLSVASSAIAFLIQQSSSSISSFALLPLKFRISNALISYAGYMEQLFWPSRLAVFYPHPVENVSVLYAVISAILLLAVTILVLRFAKNHRYLVTGWFWYLGTLVPVIGIIQIGGFARADRYTYITLTGLFIIIAWGMSELLAKLPQRRIALGISMVIVLTALGICAHRQASYWKNSLTLFSHALAVTQDNYIAYNNLGNAYSGLGRYSEAIESYKQAIEINPNHANAYCNMGLAYFNLHRWPQAIGAYKQAVKFKPDYAQAYYNLGIAYGKLGRDDEEMEAYRQAVKIKPDYAQAYYNLGFVYGNLGFLSEATDAFKQTIKIKPDYAEAHCNLGFVYGKLDQWPEAIESYKQAIKVNPDYVEAHYNLGLAYLATGDKNSALIEYNILKSLDSRFAEDLLKQINK